MTVLHTTLDSIIVAALIGIMVAAVWTDLRSRKIPNRLTFSAMVFMLAYYSTAYGFAGCWFSVKGLLLGTGLLLPVYLIGGMGAGDAKLMGAVGAALGMQGVFTAFLFTAVIGGLYALVMIVFRYKQSREILERSALMMKVLRVYKAFFIYTGRSERHCSQTLLRGTDSNGDGGRCCLAAGSGQLFYLMES